MTHLKPESPRVGIDTPGPSPSDAGKPMKIIEMEMVARGRIELPTRGFSVRGKPNFFDSKAKIGKGFLVGGPIGLCRPTLYRTGILKI